MQRCLEIAAMGLGNAQPNPMVGSVIVHDGKIIGEGYHQRCGEAHAEVNAVAAVKDKALLKESTLYVSLEPCAHHGKTPPCADLIIKHQIPNVVIGCVDSFSEVSGKGIQRMQDRGIDVSVGILEQESRWINRRFFTFHEQKRPYIILKWAQSADGFLDRERTDNSAKINWITGPEVKRLVHQWRAEEQAILVGTTTAKNDNPSLTVREVDGNSPQRFVVDRNASLTSDLALFRGESPALRFVDQTNTEAGMHAIPLDFSTSILPQMMNELYQRDIQSLIVEGGAQLLQSFIDEGLWDEARIFTGSNSFQKGLKAPALTTEVHHSEQIGNDTLRWFYNTP